MPIFIKVNTNYTAWILKQAVSTASLLIPEYVNEAVVLPLKLH